MGSILGKRMQSFMDLIRNYKTLHIVMLGLDSAGKTTALYRLKFDQYLNTVPTIGFNCEKVKLNGRAKVCLAVHLVARHLWPLWHIVSNLGHRRSGQTAAAVAVVHALYGW
ncbi:unnamed protein product, partial [Medioppia subpectinata]